MSPDPALDLRRASRIPVAGASTPPGTLVQTTPPFTDPGGAPADGSPVPGYEITGEIARGGMGCVFAGRDLALDREVAIKTLLPGADPARFVTEARITARLPHPGIPPVHALGTLPDGGHFLAMKLIRGQTLSKLLKERPSPDADLSRFVQVFEQIAQAVGFAHSRGVIHRDLKPANVMVGEFGEVQVVDWGLAKDVRSADLAVREAETAPASPEQTRAGQIMGTPAYMAPEQARGEVVDARADVFALGGILAVILTDNPPFVGDTVMDTVLKAAQGELDDCFEELDDCAADGELVEIAKRALAPHPADRYSNGQEVAAAVAAYRAGVEERLRDAETERAKSRVREAEQRKRRRALQIAGGITLGVLLMGVIGTSVGMVQANAAADKERIASKEAREAKTAAEQAADRERRAAAAEKKANERTQKGVKQILNGVEQFAGLLQGIQPRQERVGGKPLYERLRERVEEAAGKLDADAVGDPQAVALLQTIYGDLLRELGNAAKAVELLEKARATREREFGPDHPDTLVTHTALAMAYHEAGRAAEAVALLERVRDTLVKKSGADHPDALSLLDKLATAYQEVGRVAEAVALLERVRVARITQLGADHPTTLLVLNNLAVAYQRAGRTADALALSEQIRDVQLKKLGADHIDAITNLSNLAGAHMTAGRADKAVTLFEQARDAAVKKLGADHPTTLAVLSNLALAYRLAGRASDAIALLEQVRDASVKKLGPDHPNTLSALNNLAAAYFSDDRTVDAIALFEQVRDARIKNVGADHPDTLTTLNNLASAYQRVGRSADAIALLEQVRDTSVKKSGADHPSTLAIGLNLATMYQAARDWERALPLFEQAATGVEKRQFQHDKADSILFYTVAAYEEAGQLDKAEGWQRKWAAFVKERDGAEHPYYAGELAILGLNLLRQKKWTDAESALRGCLTIREKAAPNDWTTFNTRSMLGEALAGRKRYVEAEPLLLKGYEGMKAREKQIPSGAPPRVREAIERLIDFYTATDKPDEAAKWRAERAKYPVVAPPPREVKR